MPKDETATVADDATVAPVDNNQSTAPELSQAETDALMAAADGVGGTLTPNSPVEEEDGTTDEGGDSGESDSAEKTAADDKTQSDKSDSSEQAAGSTDKAEPAPELKTDKDEAGVYKEPTTADPGEFKPNDYSFEVTTTDGKTHKIASIEEAEALAATLDDNPELISASQFMTLNRKTAVMDRGIQDDKQKHEATKTQYDQEQALAKTREDALVQWNNEINYLASNGDLPAISAEMNSADWSDPEVAKDPAVKARLEIFRWMDTENTKRMGAGLEPVKSVVDAHNAMQLEALKKGNQDTASREKSQRQAKGSMVAGSSSYTPASKAEAGIIGPGGSLDDLVLEYMNQ